MSQVLTLDEVDSDGAVQESLDAVKGDTRAHFLAKAGVFGGGAFGGAALLGLAADDAAGATSRGDVAILNFALTLEYLEAAFYTEAENRLNLDGELALFTRVVAAHERAHVRALKQVLGSRAVSRPRFDFRGTTSSVSKFRTTAQTLEDTGVAAYKGQAPRIDSNAILKAALAIHAVEARHAAWIRDLNGVSPAPRAFDAALSRRAVLAAVERTRFIVPRRRRRVAPRFTG